MRLTSLPAKETNLPRQLECRLEDVTEAKRVESALHASEQLLRSALEQ